MRIIGVMSGSSLDGLDVACVEFGMKQEQLSWSLLHFEKYDFNQNTIDRLLTLNEQHVFEIAKTEFLFSNDVSDAILDFIQKHSCKATAVSIHGHTILHMPSIKKSWQLLNPGLVSSKCRMDVIHDFRSQDMALGGQGTPMAVMADRDLFPAYDYYLNLGGIANISYKFEGQWRAYDLAPFNQLHNHFAAKEGMMYDHDGELARSGRLDHEIMRYHDQLEYIQIAPPKSLDNQEMKDTWIGPLDAMDKSPRDILFSYNHFVVEMIHRTVKEKGGQIFITGGGAKNKFFIQLLKERLKGLADVILPAVEIIDYKEAILMAYLGYLRLNNKSNFIAEASGASDDVCAGGHYIYNSQK